MWHRWAWRSALRAPLGCRPVRDCFVRRGSDSFPEQHGWMQPTLGGRCRPGRPGWSNPGRLPCAWLALHREP